MLVEATTLINLCLQPNIETLEIAFHFDFQKSDFQWLSQVERAS